jgi:hypothetical protein
MSQLARLSPVAQKARREAKAEDVKIARIYRAHCAGMQIEMTRIPLLFVLARAALHLGESDAEVGARMVDFVKGERS